MGRLIIRLTAPLFAVAMIFGPLFTFSTCPIGEDGKHMACFTAGIIAVVFGVLLTAITAYSVVEHKQGMSYVVYGAIIALSIIGFFIPGGIAPLCKDVHMRCHTLFATFVRYDTVLEIISCIFNLIMNYTHRNNWDEFNAFE